MKLFKLAFRNLTRNKRRTLITLTAISGGLALFIWSITLATGSYQEMIRVGVSTMAGSVVVQGEGYQEEQEMEIGVPDADAVAETIAGLYPEARVIQRSFIAGLLNSPVNSIGIAATAIDPALEPLVSDWHEKIVEGEFLSPDDPRGILIGAKMAEALGVGLGDKLVMMAQGEEEVNSRLFRVTGVFRTGSAEMDGFLTLIHLDAARELLEQPGASTQVSLHLPDIADAPEARDAILAALGASAGAVEVLTWDEALPEMHMMLVRDEETNNVMMGFIGLIAAFGVLNTVLMSVMERMREFGVLLALGMPPSSLSSLVLLEGTLLGFVGVSLGLGLGLAASYPLIVYGIDFSSLMGMEQVDMGGVSMSAMIYGALDWERNILFCVAGLVMTALASVYPAWRASKLQPVEAMNHI